jgi:hypothetical protein
MKIVIDIETGERECGRCEKRDIIYCSEFFREPLPQDPIGMFLRLPACLAAEQEYLRLKGGAQ